MPPRKRYVSSDSDSDIGRRVDSDSEEERKPQKKEKEKEKTTPLPPPAEQPKPTVKKAVVRLSTARRTEIIQNKQRGVDDPEYSCVQTAAGGWRVSKRKFPLDQTPKIETVAGPAGHDVHVTWMNMQQTVNDSLKSELSLLREKYEKLSGKYEEGKSKKPGDKKKKAEEKKADKKPEGKRKPPEKKPVEEYSYSYYSDSEPEPPPTRAPTHAQPRPPPAHVPPPKQSKRSINIRDF
jgi:hypothetical protein